MKARMLLCYVMLGLNSLITAVEPDELGRISFSNQTGYDILYVFYSPGDSELWGPDIIGSNSLLYTGDTLSYYVHFPESSGQFDFLAIDAAGDAYVIENFTVRDGEPALVEFNLRDYRRDGYDDLVFSQLIITNASQSDIFYLFLSPSDSTMWGIDILNDETLFVQGDSFSLLLPTERRGTSFDLLALDESNTSMYQQLQISSQKDEWFVDIQSVTPGE